MTLSGTGSRSVLVRFDRRVDFLAGANNSGEFYKPHVTVTGASTLGYAIVPASAGTKGLNVFGLKVPAAEGSRTLIWPSGADTFSYAPGIYRLVLLGSGKGSVRFRLPGLRSGATTFTPRDRVGTRISGFSKAAGPTPFYVQPDTHNSARPVELFNYTWYEGPASAAMRSSLCLYENEPVNASAPGCPGGESYGVSSTETHTAYESFSVGTALLDPGKWTAASEIDSVGAIDAAGSVFVWLER